MDGGKEGCPDERIIQNSPYLQAALQAGHAVERSHRQPRDPSDCDVPSGT